ncbi:hypothetical protein M5D96_009102, partial [Drosophila gunungcola]
MAVSRRSNWSVQSLNITSYNIRGLEGKHLDRAFLEYLGNFDIYILLETHTLPEAPATGIFEEQQPDFEFLHWKDATKVFRRGRGIVAEANGLKVLQLRLGRRELSIVPLYIHTVGWDAEFEPVRRAFKNSELSLENAIVMGDVNVRIGELKQAVEPCPCVANTNGRLANDKKRERGGRFLSFCAQNKLQILNGLTHGDSAGSYTYFSAVGNSTIDIAAVSQGLMASVVDFKVDKPE